MIDESLRGESERLSAAIKSLIEDTTNDLTKLNKDIDELTIKLQGKEMFVDRRENADFQIASDTRAMKIAMANMLNKRIEAMSADTVEYKPTGFITLGTTVELSVLAVDGKKHRVSDKKFIIKLVQEDTSTAKKGLVSITSKVGQAIIGRTSGEEVLVEAPVGSTLYSIERIF